MEQNFLKLPFTPKHKIYFLWARSHSPIENAERQILNSIKRTLLRGGKIIIPSFALERTQEVLYFLTLLLRQKKIKKDIPIYVDSPLAVNITKVFQNNWEYFDKETCYIIEGEVDVKTDTGEVTIKAGDVVVFPKGLKCIWDVKKPIKKVYKFG